MIFDTHCHLNSEELFPRIDDVILDAKKAGVEKFLIVGFDKKTSLLAVKIAEKYDFCYAAIGFHPTEVYDLNEEDLNEVFSFVNHKKVVAIGEIGLDYYWEKNPDKIELQKKYFIAQIELANKHHLPVTIHNRDAFFDCLKILKEHKPEYGCILHCYSGSVESMKECVKEGFMISLGGPVTFKNAKTPKEVALNVPLDHLLVETDSPYLAPHPLRGTVNEPKNIPLVVEEIARLRNVSKEDIEKATFQNACRVLKIPYEN